MFAGLCNFQLLVKCWKVQFQQPASEVRQDHLLPGKHNVFQGEDILAHLVPTGWLSTFSSPGLHKETCTGSPNISIPVQEIQKVQENGMVVVSLNSTQVPRFSSAPTRALFHSGSCLK